MNTVKISPHSGEARYRQFIKSHGSPLLIIDLHKARNQYFSLCRALPGVGIYYAIKAFDHPDLLSCLEELGAGFDIASNGEIKILQQLSILPRNTIHTHPIKKDIDIVTALRFGCTTFVIDNPDELFKFLPYRHRVGLLLRLAFRNSTAVVDLSKKFGVAPEEAPALLELSASLGIHIKGLSFHVGSQCSDSSEHVLAIEECNTLIRQRNHIDAVPMSILDIGGGFPVPYQSEATDIVRFCAPVRRALTTLPANVDVIAEPGRFICGPAVKCITSIIGKSQRNDRWWYYLDDGVYGSFSGQMFDHARYPLEAFSNNVKHYPSLLAGPTCDSVDVVAEDIMLPEMNIGDIVVGHMMGAYTAVSATQFNAIKKTPMVVVKDQIIDFSSVNRKAPSLDIA